MIRRVLSGLGIAILAAGALSAPAAAQTAEHTFAIGTQSFELDGKPFVIRCGEIHFARVPREYWRQRLQMCRAMGLNAVCVYLFWNFQEREEGHFDWTGQADAAEFCRLAQQEGLWVVLRPGPYSCAEWEMGGLPWWLLKQGRVELRTLDPHFMIPACRYLTEVGRVLGPLQVTHGGPILMAQVENEYGSYDADPVYLGRLRQALIDAGFNVPLFACNPRGSIANGFRPDLFQVVNFGSDPGAAFADLRKVQKTGPLMNGEYYPGWFDTWGMPHHTQTVEHSLGDLEYMLQRGESFSIYMVHGGTTFGLWSGADRPFRIDTSSYDYDAPISEAGWPTGKYWKIRELLLKHRAPGEVIPSPPPRNPAVKIGRFAAAEVAPLLENLPDAVAAEVPPTYEEMGLAAGCALYRTTLPAGPAAMLRFGQVRDFGWVSLNGKPVGIMDRRIGRDSLDLPARDQPETLDVLVEAMGRMNFGVGIADRKGIRAPVELVGAASRAELRGWRVYPLPLNDGELSALRFQPRQSSDHGPAFYRLSFSADQPADTFLDLRTWGQGVVWVNGHCLGRFWNIGPTQTMYCPGPWLKAGANSVIVLDLEGPRDAALAGLDRPILDELHPELDFSKQQ
ncbi:MAG TPA: beta-galactosidase family protein [Opitutaceae bacterium]|jgi:beta-galactosidase